MVVISSSICNIVICVCVLSNYLGFHRGPERLCFVLSPFHTTSLVFLRCSVKFAMQTCINTKTWQIISKHICLQRLRYYQRFLQLMMILEALTVTVIYSSFVFCKISDQSIISCSRHRHVLKVIFISLKVRVPGTAMIFFFKYIILSNGSIIDSFH